MLKSDAVSIGASGSATIIVGIGATGADGSIRSPAKAQLP
jgi:hypothetical protein